MKKRVVSVLLTAAMAVSLLAGCGGKSLADQAAAQGSAGLRRRRNSGDGRDGRGR